MIRHSLFCLPIMHSHAIMIINCDYVCVCYRIWEAWIILCFDYFRTWFFAVFCRIMIYNCLYRRFLWVSNLRNNREITELILRKGIRTHVHVRSGWLCIPQCVHPFIVPTKLVKPCPPWLLVAISLVFIIIVTSVLKFSR